MPELPEVETTRRGILPALMGRRLIGAEVREARMRWPVPDDLSTRIENQQVIDVKRRAKYLLIELPHGDVLLHLGMSGSLRVVPAETELRKHDHIDLLIDDGMVLRFNDPRRFGLLLWQARAAGPHPLLAKLGPEPLSDAFNAQALYQRSRGLKSAVKNFIMDQKTVVGVGNIYASEALFRAGRDPRRAAGRVGLGRYQALEQHIRDVLEDALDSGGSTLRDFLRPDGAPGYFVQSLKVYDRADLPCLNCATPIRREVIAQRASYFCPQCQR